MFDVMFHPIFVFCPRTGYPKRYEGTSPIHNGCFMWWNRELREIRDVHVTETGTQIELYR